MKPVFEVVNHLRDGTLIQVCEDTPPEPIQMACLFTHRKGQDPKTRLFMEYIIEHISDFVSAE